MSVPTWTNVTVKLSDLQPWEHNPRTMSKAEAKRLVKSRNKLGQFQTIAIGPRDEDTGLCPVYDGHQRLNAWQVVFGANSDIDARQSDRPLTEEERRELTINANEPAGAWGHEFWTWPELPEWGFDAERLARLNADAANLATMLQADDETTDADAEPQIDRAAELNEKWQVHTGDLWRIGDHRLLCGDSTKREDADRVMGGELSGAIITDPPYNIEKDKWDKIDDFVNWIRSWFLVLPDVTTFVFTGSLHCGLWWMVKPPRALYCWHKPNGQGNNPFGGTTKWEPILVWNPPHDKQTDFIEHNNEYNEEEGLSDIHLTPKPVGLIQKLIQKTGGTVDDYFAGTGTTLVACQNLQRKCRAIEISPNYCAVILERMITAFPDIVIERIEN